MLADKFGFSTSCSPLCPGLREHAAFCNVCSLTAFFFWMPPAKGPNVLSKKPRSYNQYLSASALSGVRLSTVSRSHEVCLLPAPVSLLAQPLPPYLHGAHPAFPSKNHVAWHEGLIINTRSNRGLPSPSPSYTAGPYLSPIIEYRLANLQPIPPSRCVVFLLCLSCCYENAEFKRSVLLSYFTQQFSDLMTPFLDHLIQTAFPLLRYANDVSSVWVMTSF